MGDSTTVTLGLGENRYIAYVAEAVMVNGVDVPVAISPVNLLSVMWVMMISAVLMLVIMPNDESTDMLCSFSDTATELSIG